VNRMTNVNIWLKGFLLLFFVMALGVGCESKAMDNEGAVTLAELEGAAPTAADVAEVQEVVETVVNDDGTVETTSVSSGQPSEITGSIKWLNTDVSGWAVTASLSASVSGGTINMPYSKAKVWHAVGGLNANPWAIVNIGGQWYAGTFEYFRYGQTSKPVGVLDGSKGQHFNASPLTSWRPSSGERFGIMISGLARSAARNVQERSNISMVTWP